MSKGSFDCNVMFSRTVRPPHKRRRVETRCACGVTVNRPWSGDHKGVCEELMKHAPEGEGWMVGGYARIKRKSKKGKVTP